MVLKDCLELDPAARYQIAKNAFERALFDAIVSDDDYDEWLQRLLMMIGI